MSEPFTKSRAELLAERRLCKVVVENNTLCLILQGRLRLVFSVPVVIVSVAEVRDYPMSRFAIFVGAEAFEPVDAALEVPVSNNYQLMHPES